MEQAREASKDACAALVDMATRHDVAPSTLERERIRSRDSALAQCATECVSIPICVVLDRICSLFVFLLPVTLRLAIALTFF